MLVQLQFSLFFKSLFEQSTISVSAAPGSTLGEVLELWLNEYPNMRAVLDEKQLFLNGNLRAVYLIDGQHVQSDFRLEEDAVVQVLKAFVGG